MAIRSLDLESASNIGGAVEASLKTKTPSFGKKSKAKGVSVKSPKPKATPKGKTPSATNVRGAMAEGKITPEEAGNLNPNAGFKPEWNDVRDAFTKGHITTEEAADLLGRKPRAPKETKRGAQWVRSERVDTDENSPKPYNDSNNPPLPIEAPRKAIGAGEEQLNPNPRKGKQFTGSTARLAGNRLSWDDMQTGKYAGAIFPGKTINKRSGIKVGERPSTRAKNDPEYKDKLLADLNKEAGRHGE